MSWLLSFCGCGRQQRIALLDTVLIDFTSVSSTEDILMKLLDLFQKYDEDHNKKLEGDEITNFFNDLYDHLSAGSMPRPESFRSEKIVEWRNAFDENGDEVINFTEFYEAVTTAIQTLDVAKGSEGNQYRVSNKVYRMSAEPGDLDFNEDKRALTTEEQYVVDTTRIPLPALWHYRIWTSLRFFAVLYYLFIVPPRASFLENRFHYSLVLDYMVDIICITDLLLSVFIFPRPKYYLRTGNFWCHAIANFPLDVFMLLGGTWTGWCGCGR